MKLFFRKVESKDLADLQQISLETFRATYEHLNDPTHFENYIQDAFSYSQLEVEFTESESAFYFAYAKNELAGYFKLNFNRAEADLKASESVELERIYLRRSFQNQGLGAQLIQKAIEIARDAGFLMIWLGVWQENPKAVRFYQRQGFEIFGEHDFYIGTDCQKDWIMKQSLGEPSGKQ